MAVPFGAVTPFGGDFIIVSLKEVKNYLRVHFDDDDALIRQLIRVYSNGVELNITTHQMINGNIDKLTITAAKHTVCYRVRTIGSKYYFDWMENSKDTGGSADNYAGEQGKEIDRIQITVKS